MQCKMINRKPFPVYSLVEDTRKAFLVKSEDEGVRCKRWKMIVNPDKDLFFSSKRAAIHFFQTGEKYKTKPVYSVRNKSQKRIR